MRVLLPEFIGQVVRFTAGSRFLVLFAWLFGSFVWAEEGPESTPQSTQTGLSAAYFEDRGIASDPAVFVATGFETDQWMAQWDGSERKTVHVIAADKSRGFAPHLGKALRIVVDAGGHYGASLSYPFQKREGEEPESVFFRYYLRLGADWDPEGGGKLPGIGGTYGRAGWGGRPSDGRNGWSARGQFGGYKDGRTPTGFYCYHADMRGQYGSSWYWQNKGLGNLANDRWYCVEQQVQMNTPGKNDGVLRGWIDGKLAFEKLDVRMRDVPTLKIQNIWLNIYHGGKWSAKTEDSLFIDNIVVARRYIGPMRSVR